MPSGHFIIQWSLGLSSGFLLHYKTQILHKSALKSSFFVSGTFFPFFGRNQMFSVLFLDGLTIWPCILYWSSWNIRLESQFLEVIESSLWYMWFWKFCNWFFVGKERIFLRNSGKWEKDSGIRSKWKPFVKESNLKGLQSGLYVIGHQKEKNDMKLYESYTIDVSQTFFLMWKKCIFDARLSIIPIENIFLLLKISSREIKDWGRLNRRYWKDSRNFGSKFLL